jgi:hypothetical protein
MYGASERNGLTDYDFVGKLGEPLASPGTVLYCAPSYQEGRPASPSDDVYALAASLFHVLFERQPFRYGQQLDKRRGLNWEGIARDDFPILASWLDKATHPDARMRFASVGEARQALAGPALTMAPTAAGAYAMPVEPLVPPEPPPTEPVRTELGEERVPWLLSLLQSYPGSRWGNRETRGLDTEFASQTYVETQLEETLLRDIRERRVRLVILCGNAGDGKTALLQHLAQRLELGRHQSSERVLEARLDDGLLVRMNLDGSASWQGRWTYSSRRSRAGCRSRTSSTSSPSMTVGYWSGSRAARPRSRRRSTNSSSGRRPRRSRTSISSA